MRVIQKKALMYSVAWGMASHYEVLGQSSSLMYSCSSLGPYYEPLLPVWKALLPQFFQSAFYGVQLWTCLRKQESLQGDKKAPNQTN